MSTSKEDKSFGSLCGFDHVLTNSACLNGFFLTTKYIAKSEESTSLFERAASSNIKQNSLSLVAPCGQKLFVENRAPPFLLELNGLF